MESNLSTPQEAQAERDEAERIGRARGDGLGQRAVSLSAELREARAVNSRLKATNETGTMGPLLSPHKANPSQARIHGESLNKSVH